MLPLSPGLGPSSDSEAGSSAEPSTAQTTPNLCAGEVLCILPTTEPDRPLTLVRRLPRPRPKTAAQYAQVRDELERVDEVRQLIGEGGPPIEYVRDLLVRMGPDLYNTALSTRIQPLANLAAPTPSHLRCDVFPSPSGAPPPTCILKVSFGLPAGSPNILVPAYSLLWSLHSPAFRRVLLASSLSSPPTPRRADADPTAVHLPVVALQLPCSIVFESFYHLIHHRALPDPPLHTAPAPAGPASTEQAVEYELGQGQRIYALWKTLRALEWDDDECWEAVGRGWERAVGLVEVAEARRVTASTRARTESWLRG